MEYWCVNDKIRPQWVEDLINRGLLIHKGSTGITDCYQFKDTLHTTSPTYLYDGDGLCFEDNTIGVVFYLYSYNFEELKKEVPVIKYYCDICGEEIFDKKDIYNLKIENKENPFSGSKIKKEICKDCFININDILRRKVKN